MRHARKQLHRNALRQQILSSRPRRQPAPSASPAPPRPSPDTPAAPGSCPPRQTPHPQPPGETTPRPAPPCSEFGPVSMPICTWDRAGCDRRRKRILKQIKSGHLPTHLFRQPAGQPTALLQTKLDNETTLLMVHRQTNPIKVSQAPAAAEASWERQRQRRIRLTPELVDGLMGLIPQTVGQSETVPESVTPAVRKPRTQP